ncbi:MAG: energy transducer TonB [Chloracidobacterium sp.]|nr:energy transducer TonB [Chloracidobacterium sp.]
MFDKLIETEPEGADFHNRRSYFMVSSIVVGILFVTAVVISIYASDYGLGNDSFELATVVAPPEIAAPELKPQRLQTARIPSQSTSDLPTKPSYVAPMDKPNSIPTTISTVPTSFETWNSPDPAPIGPDNPSGGGRDRDSTDGSPDGIVRQVEPTEPEPIPEPPPVIKKPVEIKPTVVRSAGPVNGKATYLPKPPYPAAAVALNLQGKVDVQVTIDENGKVVSAKAINGNALFRGVAERAAWQAKFSPTYLGKMPVKVTGVIVYNFTK